MIIKDKRHRTVAQNKETHAEAVALLHTNIREILLVSYCLHEIRAHSSKLLPSN